MKSLSRESGFSAPIVMESPPLSPSSERLLQQVAALGEPQQVAHPGVGGELRLVRQHLGAAQHDGVRLVREIEDPLPLGDEDVEQLAAVGRRRPRRAAARPSVARICCNVSPASRSFRIRATCCTALGRDPAGHLHEDGADHAAPQIEHQQQPLRRSPAPAPGARAPARRAPGTTATPSSWVSTPSTCAARRRISSTAFRDPMQLGTQGVLRLAGSAGSAA